METPSLVTQTQQTNGHAKKWWHGTRHPRPEEASKADDPTHEGIEIPKKSKGGRTYGMVLENGGGTTIGPVEGRSWKLGERKFWMQPLGRHFTTAPIPAGIWLYTWTAGSAQPVTADLGPAPNPEILDHLTGSFPPSLQDEGLREDTKEGPGFVFQLWMAICGLAALAIIGAAVLVYMYYHKKGAM